MRFEVVDELQKYELLRRNPSALIENIMRKNGSISFRSILGYDCFIEGKGGCAGWNFGNALAWVIDMSRL